jgi:hypothetical protein
MPLVTISHPLYRSDDASFFSDPPSWAELEPRLGVDQQRNATRGTTARKPPYPRTHPSKQQLIIGVIVSIAVFGFVLFSAGRERQRHLVSGVAVAVGGYAAARASPRDRG